MTALPMDRQGVYSQGTRYGSLFGTGCEDMTDKELRRLSRMELIQLLLEQAKELERVQQELEETKTALEDQQIRIHNAGSIAEASLQINQVMETAQKAADLYLKNVQREYVNQVQSQYNRIQVQLREMEKAAKAKCDAMLREAQGKAETYEADKKI